MRHYTTNSEQTASLHHVNTGAINRLVWLWYYSKVIGY